jgi:16S rRNA (guanine527-N7)-methyltransferase
MFHVKHEGWELADRLDLSLDPATIDRLERYERLLLEQAVPMGMVAPSDAPRIRERHIIDSLRALPFLPEQGTVCDLGSGAGLPGLVLAITRPDLRFVLVEVRKNRAAFLERAVDDLSNVVVHGRRLETFREKVQACTSRAFAPPSRSWGSAAPLLAAGGTLIYWGGASFDGTADVPDGVSARLFTTTALARSGPLVIMAQQ